MRMTALGLAACLAAGLTGACWAQDLKATPKLGDTEIAFDPGGTYGNYTLTVTGPNGFHASAESKTTAPSIDLRRFGAYGDGVYHYHLTASTDEKIPTRTALDNGRDKKPDSMLKSASLNGVFHVKDRTIVKFDPAAREPASRQK